MENEYFYTSLSIVELLVKKLEPYLRPVFNLRCGFNGIFVHLKS